ncbi:MAG: hypothetical protein AMXMBFR8_23390 [Nevskiales bacterium]
MRRVVGLMMLLLLAVQTAGCGLLLYPERKGQKSGNIDPGVAILDAAGLVVFIVPGLIAFGVDFATGCIYLPPGQKGAAAEEAAPRTLYVDPATLDQPALEETVAQATGRPVDLGAPAVRAVAVADAEAVSAVFAATQ